MERVWRDGRGRVCLGHLEGKRVGVEVEENGLRSTRNPHLPIWHPDILPLSATRAVLHQGTTTDARPLPVLAAIQAGTTANLSEEDGTEEDHLDRGTTTAVVVEGEGTEAEDGMAGMDEKGSTTVAAEEEEGTTLELEEDRTEIETEDEATTVRSPLSHPFRKLPSS